jgi:hypothetical protein
VVFLDNSVKCVREIRAVPRQAYRMANDGRQWKHLCNLRRILLNHLATYANPDGTSINVGVTRLCVELGFSRRTIFRLLDDLRELGFLSDGKLTGFKGTRQRELNVAAITGAIDVPPSPVGVPSSDDSSATFAPTDVPPSHTRVPPSHIPTAESAEGGTQPSLRTVNKPTNLTGKVGTLFFNHNQSTMNLRKQDTEQFMAAIQQHGEVPVLLAWEAFVLTGDYNNETKYPAYLFFKDGNSENYIAAAKLKMQDPTWRIAHDSKYAAQVEESIRRQAAENWKRLTTAPPEENGGSVLDYFQNLKED